MTPRTKRLATGGSYLTRFSITSSIFRNLRYAAYKTLFAWFYPNRKPGGGRYPVPSCFTSSLRATFPSENYTGFCPKSPMLKKRRK